MKRIMLFLLATIRLGAMTAEQEEICYQAYVHAKTLVDQIHMLAESYPQAQDKPYLYMQRVSIFEAFDEPQTTHSILLEKEFDIPHKIYLPFGHWKFCIRASLHNGGEQKLLEDITELFDLQEAQDLSYKPTRYIGQYVAPGSPVLYRVKCFESYQPVEIKAATDMIPYLKAKEIWKKVTERYQKELTIHQPWKATA